MARNKFSRNCLSTITIAALLLAAPMAYATEGSHPCGYSAEMPPNALPEGRTLTGGGKVGMLYELRQNDNSAEKQCNDVKKRSKTSLTKTLNYKVSLERRRITLWQITL